MISSGTKTLNSGQCGTLLLSVNLRWKIFLGKIGERRTLGTMSGNLKHNLEEDVLGWILLASNGTTLQGS